MAIHSYVRCWIHLIWGTKSHAKLLSKEQCVRVSEHLHEYTRENGLYMKVNFVNPDHVHVLIDLPDDVTIRDTVKLLKGESSHWINENHQIPGGFHWQRGYGAFSVSQSRISPVCKYIVGQGEHHRIKTYDEEVRLFIKNYGLKWREENEKETVETVPEK